MQNYTHRICVKRTLNSKIYWIYYDSINYISQYILSLRQRRRRIVWVLRGTDVTSQTFNLPVYSTYKPTLTTHVFKNINIIILFSCTKMFPTKKYEECKYISPNTATVRSYKQAAYSCKQASIKITKSTILQCLTRSVFNATQQLDTLGPSITI
jgi:hypothetical protein